jgi:GTP-binding protein EngB required for normal cell division
MEDDQQSHRPNLASLENLHNTDGKALLDTIDGLREQEVGDMVSLPQIIVVGDQCAGKSSVLEAISRVQFPVKGDVCTRFATELVLRRAANFKVSVKIRFASGADNQVKFLKTSLDRNDLGKIVEEAKHHMGIHLSGNKRFSKDVLRVEISGPEVYSLTLVDLPGFFHSETAEQTSEDKVVVEQLVESYMKQKNSIILAIVAANYQLASQIVLEKAKTYDPNRERTLGVITKTDLISPGSADEKKCVDLIAGKEKANKFRLGWHALRNRSDVEEGLGPDLRDKNENDHFKTGVWGSIALAPHCGIEFLRQKLSKVLLKHIQATLPEVIGEIESNLRIRQEKLEQLGKARSDTEELRLYLLGISKAYERLSREAINGYYNNPFFGGIDEGDRKLRALLRNYSKAFNLVLLQKGETFSIKWVDDSNDDSEPEDTGYSDNGNVPVPEYLQPLVDMYNVKSPAIMAVDDVRLRLESLASKNLGNEVPGSTNSDLIIQLFKDQSLPWKVIAQEYLRLVLQFTQAIVEDMFGHIIGLDETTYASILRNYVCPFFQERRKVLNDKLDELVRPYIDGFCVPLETEFHLQLSERSRRRMANRIADILEDEFSDVFNEKPKAGLNRKNIRKTLIDSRSIESSTFAPLDVVDMTAAFYEVGVFSFANEPLARTSMLNYICSQISLRTFTENVINLAAESCLIRELPGIFTVEMVGRMKENRLRELASESDDLQRERQILEGEVNKLRAGYDLCHSYRPFERAGKPTIEP